MGDYISGLDTKRFGFKIAKINDFKGDAAGLIKQLKAEGVKMVIGRVKSSNLKDLNELEDNGFRVMDTQLTYRYDMKDIPANLRAAAGTIVLRGHKPEDTEQIVEIAGEAFDNYGHYFADKLLDRSKCSEIYRDWARRSCMDKSVADMVFVAELDNTVAGFATFKVSGTGAGEEPRGVCGLGAVASNRRGAGIYPAIINSALIWGKENGLIWEEYSCIACNFPANRAYINSGFKPVDSFVTLHCWL